MDTKTNCKIQHNQSQNPLTLEGNMYVNDYKTKKKCETKTARFFMLVTGWGWGGAKEGSEVVRRKM